MNELPRLLNRLPGDPGHNGNGRHHNGHAAHSHPLTLNGSAHAPRVLILSVSAGTGHLRAAEAVELALRQVRPDAHVKNLDVLDLATAPFRRCYGRMYVEFIDLAPQVLGFFYNLMDKGRQVEPNHWDRLRIALERMSLRPFVYLLSQPWDLIISTHFLPGEIVATLRREKRIATPHVMITTDFETHRLWVNQPCEHYFTATDEAALYLQTFGVPRGDATATGIPIHPVFSRAKDRAACRARQGLAGDRPVILQLSGGCGVGRIDELYRILLDVEIPSEIVVVTAYNTRAKEALEAIPVPGRHRARILGFTREIDELMRAADLVVSKPGGLTTSELLAVGAAIVVVDPVPGQEDRNSDFLLENGAAIKVNHLPTMAHKLTSLLRDPGRLAQMRANAQRLGRPRAAFEVVERSLALLPAARKTEERRKKKDESKGEPVLLPAYQKPAKPGQVALTGVGRFVRQWRASGTWFELFELQMMHMFARLWHRCSSNGSPPLPVTGPALVVANHPSNADPAFLLSACARPLRFLHAREYFDVFLLRRLFRWVGCIPVGRKGRDVGAIRQALQRLQEGSAVCVFPEGDLSPGVLPCEHGTTTDVLPGKTGAAFLALKSRAPVYPAYIDGGPRSRRLLPDWLWPSPGVRVVFGPPIDLSAYHGRPITHDLLREVTDIIMRRIAALGPAPVSRVPSQPRARVRVSFSREPEASARVSEAQGLQPLSLR